MSTGDVVEITATKAIRIIDRAKSIFKLSQGEYIAPDKLENIYSTVDMVEQIYVHGQPDKVSITYHIMGQRIKVTHLKI